MNRRSIRRDLGGRRPFGVAAVAVVLLVDAGSPEVTTKDGPTDGPADESSDAECGGLTASAVGAAAGVGNFDTADDLSIDTDVTCLFTPVPT